MLKTHLVAGFQTVILMTKLTSLHFNNSTQGESRFVCGQFGCGAEWSYAEVCKMALLTPEEKKHFERTMALNATDTRSVSVLYLVAVLG